MDGLLPTIYIDEAHPSTQMDEPLLFTLTSPSLHFRWTGSLLQLLSMSSSLNMDELLLFTVTSPSLHIKQTGSSLLSTSTSSSKQLYLTSSYSLNGRALTTAYLTSSSLQLYLTSSFYLHERTLPNSST